MTVPVIVRAGVRAVVPRPGTAFFLTLSLTATACSSGGEAGGAGDSSAASSGGHGARSGASGAATSASGPSGSAAAGASGSAASGSGPSGSASGGPAGAGASDSSSDGADGGSGAGADGGRASAGPTDANPRPGDAAASTDPDASPVDAIAVPSPDAAPCIGLFCEDFESGRIDPTVWDTQTFGGQTVGVQSATVAHGKYAAAFHAKPNLLSYDFIITKSAPAALSRHFFGRAYFYITPGPPAAHMGFFFAGTPGFPNHKYIEVASIGKAWQFTFVDLKVNAGQAVAATGTQETYANGGTVPVQRWACLEWEVNDAPDQETVYIDGKQDFTLPRFDLNGVTSGLVGGFSDFGFGYYAWHPSSAPIDVYYDDIVLDTKRIGCLP